MSEIVSRQIFELQEKIRKAEEKIKAIEDLIKQLEELAEKATPIEKYYWYPRRIARERMSIGALRSQIARWQRKIEELKKLLPPFKYQSIEKSFSIQTNEDVSPFECEVTAVTVFPADISPAEREEKLKRINNVCVKYFFILFDSYKDIGSPGPHSEIANSIIRAVGKEFHSKLFKAMIYFAKYLPPIPVEQYQKIKWLLDEIKEGVRREEVLYVTEEEMDAFLTILLHISGLRRASADELRAALIKIKTPPAAAEEYIPPLMRFQLRKREAEEYVTHMFDYTTQEAILKISITPPAPTEHDQPQYPECLLYIEKKTKPPFTAFRKVKIAPTTAIDMLSILGMREEYE